MAPVLVFNFLLRCSVVVIVLSSCFSAVFLFSHIPDLAVWVISKIGLICARYMYVLRKTTELFCLIQFLLNGTTCNPITWTNHSTSSLETAKNIAFDPTENAHVCEAVLFCFIDFWNDWLWCILPLRKSGFVTDFPIEIAKKLIVQYGVGTSVFSRWFQRSHLLMLCYYHRNWKRRGCGVLRKERKLCLSWSK